MRKTKTIYGASLTESQQVLPPRIPSLVNIPCFQEGERFTLQLGEETLSKHILLIGGIGSGKTNLLYYIVDAIKEKMTKNDIMLIFDTKGDYISKFFRADRDVVIANSIKYTGMTKKWNIYREIAIDGFEDKHINENTREIINSLFKPVLEKNQSQPFFPLAASDLLASILIAQIRIGRDDTQFKRTFFNNLALSNYINRLNIEELSVLFRPFPDLAASLSYVGDGSSDQALGVLAELQAIIRPLLIGEFAEKGFFSVRDFVRNKGGKTLFMEYDLSMGEILTPIYKLLFDVALKEALGRTEKQGNVYLICDEFKLLPNLEHIEDGVNFGRSLGVKIIAGIQSVDQIKGIYGAERGNSILSGFSTLITFHTRDARSRQFVRDSFGKNLVLDRYQGHNGNIIEDKREGNAVEDWEITELKVGEAIVGLPFTSPFKTKFEKYRVG